MKLILLSLFLSATAFANIEGDWTLSFDWGCDGKYLGEAIWTFEEDRTFTDSYKSFGEWKITEDYFELKYNTGEYAEYTGTLTSETHLKGTMIVPDDQSKGCFTADKNIISD